MKSFKLALSDAPAQLIPGINTGVDSGEHEGIPLGIPERVCPDFTVRLASGEIAPLANGGTVRDCVPRLAAATPDQSTMVLWLEKTPAYRRDDNASLVLVHGYVGFTTLRGKPRFLASGPDMVIIELRNNEAVRFIGRNGNQTRVVLYTEDNAREPKLRFVADSATRRTVGTAPAAASTSRR